MPVRHCVFIADLAEMEKAFQLPLSVYVDEFLERPTPGDRLREYAELAFADEQQIQTLRKADRETMVMARRLMTPGQGPRTELPAHLNDVTGDYVKTRTTSQFKWMLHAFSHFRLVPSFSVPTVARTLATIDFSTQAFQDAGRTSAERLHTLAKENTSKFRAALQLPYARPAVLAFVGS